MKKLRLLLRIIQINSTLARYGLDELIVSLHFFAPLRFFIYLNPFYWIQRHRYPRGVALRLALEELGPIFIKFGQALSTRRDLLPSDIIIELCQLQSNVPGFSGQIAKQIVIDAFKCPLENIFASFDEIALASASIAQVHAATLLDGSHVVVKILRPNIENIISRDLALLILFAKLADRYWHEAVRIHPIEIVDEFAKTLLDECDLHREAANAALLRRNALKTSLLYVPLIHWEFVHNNVLIMERIYGIPINDVAALHHHQINIHKLAENGVKIFFTQLFNDNFFHADMHPGNIFVSPLHRDNPQYICVDFGIVGSLAENDKRYLAENFHAFFNRDYQRVAELHVESGWVPHYTSIVEFEAAIRTVCEPIFERPLSQISMAQMLMRLLRTGRRFDMELQPQLLLLQKTLFAIEGLGRQLYPELDLWTTAKPFIEDWMREQTSIKTFIRNLAKHGPLWFEKLPELPLLLQDIALQRKLEFQQSIAMQRSQIIATRNTQRLQRRYIGYISGTALAGVGLSQLPGLHAFVVHAVQQPFGIAIVFALAGLGFAYGVINRE